MDSSVWIDYFQGAATPETDTLHSLLRTENLAIGDLILTEVLQGFARDRDFDRAKTMLTSLTVIEIGGEAIAIQAARNYRQLRGLGITIRKTIDCLIATRCIESELRLLHDDKDFDPFVKHLGLSIVVP